MSRQTKRTKLGAAAALVVLAVACGTEDGPVGTREVEIEDVIADPQAHEGQRVRFTAFYVGSFEESVLAAALAESYPPQPAQPAIWVEAQPQGGCLISDAGVTWGEVVAEGVLRHDEAGGFGHLGVFTMHLVDARVACP